MVGEVIWVCLVRLDKSICIESACGYGISYRCPNGVHVWSPIPVITCKFSSQIERNIASMNCCTLYHLYSILCPPRAPEEKVVYCLSCQSTFALVCRRSIDSMEVRVQSCHACSQLREHSSFPPRQSFIELTRVFPRQCFVNPFRMLTYIIQ